jgi:molecular chaperone DnaK (HSP70)
VPSFSKARSASRTGDWLTSNFSAKPASAKWSPGLKTSSRIASRTLLTTTVAAFSVSLHQCNATRKAAELAGLKGSPLVQEPVAAALACGFQLDSEKAYWLVYDFGGGTFDAALIKAEEGLINVVHHGGDNHLGGSDIDWAIIERIVAPNEREHGG